MPQRAHSGPYVAASRLQKEKTPGATREAQVRFVVLTTVLSRRDNIFDVKSDKR